MTWCDVRGWTQRRYGLYGFWPECMFFTYRRRVRKSPQLGSTDESQLRSLQERSLRLMIEGAGAAEEFHMPSAVHKASLGSRDSKCLPLSESFDLNNPANSTGWGWGMEVFVGVFFLKLLLSKGTFEIFEVGSWRFRKAKVRWGILSWEDWWRWVRLFFLPPSKDVQDTRRLSSREGFWPDTPQHNIFSQAWGLSPGNCILEVWCLLIEKGSSFRCSDGRGAPCGSSFACGNSNCCGFWLGLLDIIRTAGRSWWWYVESVHLQGQQRLSAPGELHLRGGGLLMSGCFTKPFVCQEKGARILGMLHERPRSYMSIWNATEDF